MFYDQRSPLSGNVISMQRDSPRARVEQRHFTDLLSADISIAFALPFLAFELGKHATSSCPSQRNVVNICSANAVVCIVLV